MIVAVMLMCIAAAISCTHTAQQQQVSFSKDIVPLFTSYCSINSSCHLGANGGNQDVALDSSEAYASIMAKGLVSVSDPASSLLYVEVFSDEMPKPPAAPLSAAEQALLLNWIKQGAQNN